MDRDEHREVTRRIGRHFSRPWDRNYARNKLRFDPVYAAAAEVFLDGGHDVLDVGCGLGLLGFYLRERGFGARYRGVDHDRAKIDSARRAAAASSCNLDLDEADAAALPSFRGHVALLDVLHYLPEPRQRALLDDIATCVAPGAAIVVRSVLRTPGWRFRITVWEERWLHAIRWMRSPALHFPDRDAIESPLRAAGLDVDVRPLWGNTPFNSFVIVARRPA